MFLPYRGNSVVVVVTSFSLANMSDTGRKFARAAKDKYSLEEKEALGKLCKRYNDEFDAIVQNIKKTVNFSDKRKKHTKMVSRERYVTKAVREFYPDLKKSKHDNPSLSRKRRSLGNGVLTKRLKLNRRYWNQL